MAELILPDEAATARLAERLALFLKAGDIVTLSGSLGAGKTTLTRYILRALGVSGRVKSPSFALMEPYDCQAFQLCHFDFYRFDRAGDWRDAGFDDLIGATDTVCLIEWPQMALGSLPSPTLEIELMADDPAQTEARRVRLTGGSERTATWLSALVNDWVAHQGPMQ